MSEENKENIETTQIEKNDNEKNEQNVNEEDEQNGSEESKENDTLKNEEQEELNEDEISVMSDLSAIDKKPESKGFMRFIKYFIASLIDTAFSLAIAKILMLVIDRILRAAAGLYFAEDQIYTVLLMIFVGVSVLYYSISKTVWKTTVGQKLFDLK